MTKYITVKCNEPRAEWLKTKVASHGAATQPKSDRKRLLWEPLVHCLRCSPPNADPREVALSKSASCQPRGGAQLIKENKPVGRARRGNGSEYMRLMTDAAHRTSAVVDPIPSRYAHVQRMVRTSIHFL